MKLSIKDNCVCMCLTRSEVDVLRDRGLVVSETGFPDSRKLRYQIESSPASVHPAASFSENTVAIRLPESTVLEWATTANDTLRGEQLLDDGEVLSILIEKDFACLTEADGEEEPDMLAHSAAGQRR